MLDAFITTNRDTILERVRDRVSSRTSPLPTDAELRNGIPVFLDQLGDALRLARASTVVDHEQIGQSAARHGKYLLGMGLTIAQVVHDYGAVCQVITELAVALAAPISSAEFRTLNLCLDDAIAEAVTEFAHQRERTLAAEGTERLGILAHELRNHLGTAMLSFASIQAGHVAPGGSTGQVLARSLVGLRDLIDRSLATVRLDVGLDMSSIQVAAFLEEVEVAAALQAKSRGLDLAVSPVDRTVTIEGDRPVLAAALSNLLQNACKFTRPHTRISLTTHVTAHSVRFDVEDECGGLPPGKADELFSPYSKRGTDRSGVGLGLVICVKAAEANGGRLTVRDLPGKGCVFSLELPRKPPPPLTVIDGGRHDESAVAVAAPAKSRP